MPMWEQYAPTYRPLMIPQHYEDGKEQGITPGWHKADTTWHENWLNNRKRQLENNMRQSGIQSSVEEEIER